jgi:hypothetical protein
VAGAGARDLFVDLIPDIAARAERYRGDLDVTDPAIRAMFSGDVLDLVACLSEACSRRDETTIRDKGHSLEGMGGTMGFPEISVAGGELSQAARARDWARCQELADRLARWSKILSREPEE